jgi:putative transposase
MPRTARVAPKEQIYHVLTRGNNRQDVFKDPIDFTTYLDLLLKYKKKYLFKLYHYVLMTNHVHLIIEPTKEGGDLSEIMKGINLSYASYYKRKNSHIGHFWQDRYKSIIVSKDEYLLACGTYVELNPVRARMVKDPRDYPWSSYKVYAYGREDGLIDEHPIYALLLGNESKQCKKYREFAQEMLEEKNAMKGEMDKRIVFGGVEFLKTINKVFQISEKIRPKGRQRGWRKNKENRPV